MQDDLKEVSTLLDSLYEFNVNIGDEILNKEQMKVSNSMRNTLKKIMSFGKSISHASEMYGGYDVGNLKH